MSEKTFTKGGRNKFFANWNKQYGRGYTVGANDDFKRQRGELRKYQYTAELGRQDAELVFIAQCACHDYSPPKTSSNETILWVHEKHDPAKP